MIHMEYYLIVSTIMMFVGIYGFVTRRNLLAMLISVELILNSVDINFVVSPSASALRKRPWLSPSSSTSTATCATSRSKI